jgi:Ankyrin repeats (3 copies)
LTNIPKLLRIARNSSEELKSQIPRIKRTIILNNSSEGWDNVRLIDVIVIHATGGIEKDVNLSLFEHDLDTSLPLNSTTEKILTGARRSNNPAVYQRTSRARSPRPGKEGAAAGSLKFSAIAPSSTYDSLSRRADTGLSLPPEAERPNWLTDEAMLPSAVPVAQIMVFNLDLGSNSYAPIDFDGTAAAIETQIRELRVDDQFRSMVFIGHGYGNVVLERLLASHTQEQVPKTGFVGAVSKSAFIDSTAAIVFFAAPFLSSDPLIEWTAQALKVSKSAKIFSSLSSKDLITPSKVWAEFLGLAKQKNVCSIAFLEQNLDQGLEEISREKADVDKLKSMLDDVSENPKGIEDVAKFSGPNDAKFWKMCALIDTAVQTHQFLGAAKRGDNNAIKKLIKQSINVNISFGNGQTALHWATREKKINVIKTLVENDSLDIDRQAEDGTTALHLAVSHENLHGFVEEDIMDELLAAGASPSIRDRRGRTPHDIIDLVKKPPLWMKIRLKRAQLVKGPSAWPDLTRGKPPAGIGITACENTTMKLKGVFAARPGQPDNHVQISPSILELIYSDEDAETILESYHGPTPGILVPQVPIKEFCQWFHIPANNVRVAQP